MAATALSAFGHLPPWCGGAGASPAGDSTSVVQGVVTGIGFLCAGVIMKDGLSIRGLTTAASIWAVAAVGVLLGTGFHVAAILLALLCVLSMWLLRSLETRLPARATLDITLTFRQGFQPELDKVTAIAEARGYHVLRDSVTITFADEQPAWRFCAVATERSRALSPTLLAEELSVFPGISRFGITPVRN
jgi:putative Mg2+ transporter-C (MgtC) family protein